MKSESLLLALSHAASGSAGTVISTLSTYPLDLATTRLKVQRQLARDGVLSESETYAGLLDALRSIRGREGGLGALYAGLSSDLAKSAADSFLFFLFYNWLRARRLLVGGGGGATGRRPRRRRRLGALEELAVGAVAGACARAITMPVSNVVTRMQTAALVEGRQQQQGDGDGEGKTDGAGGGSAGVGDVLRQIWRERGLAGLWAGYSASLVLTLNPSVTFFLDHWLRAALVPEEGDGPGRGATFLLAATSKAVATALTYPFQTAKARAQVSFAPSPPPPSPPRPSEEPRPRGVEGGDGGGGGGAGIDMLDLTGTAPGGASSSSSSSPSSSAPQAADVDNSIGSAVEGAASAASRSVRRLAHDNIFAAVGDMVRAEGIGALYAGLAGELLKAFLGHGITMVSKDLVHGLVVRLYLALAGAWRALQARRRGDGGGERYDPSSMIGAGVYGLPGGALRDGSPGVGERFGRGSTGGPGRRGWGLGGRWGGSGGSGGVAGLKPVRRTVTEVTEIVVANMVDGSQRLIKGRW